MPRVVRRSSAAGSPGLAAAHGCATAARARTPRSSVLEAGDRLGGKLRTGRARRRSRYDDGRRGVPAPATGGRRGWLGAARAGRRLVHPGRRRRPSVRAAGGTAPLPAGHGARRPDRPRRGWPAVLSPAGAGRGGRRTRPAAALDPGGDVAVGALLRARFGDEVVDRLVEPLLGGVYAGPGRRRCRCGATHARAGRRALDAALRRWPPRGRAAARPPRAARPRRPCTRLRRVRAVCVGGASRRLPRGRRVRGLRGGSTLSTPSPTVSRAAPGAARTGGWRLAARLGPGRTTSWSTPSCSPSPARRPPGCSPTSPRRPPARRRRSS